MLVTESIFLIVLQFSSLIMYHMGFFLPFNLSVLLLQYVVKVLFDSQGVLIFHM